MKQYTIKNYSKIDESLHKLPVLKKLKNSNLEFWYFASIHSNDIDSTIFIDIQKCFDDLKPDLVILEGSTKINKTDPRRNEYFDKVLQKSLNKNIEEGGEFRFGLYLALKSKIEVFCPEPSEMRIIEHLLSKYKNTTTYVNLLLESLINNFNNEDQNIIELEVKEFLETEIKYYENMLKGNIAWVNFDFSLYSFLQNFYLISRLNFDFMDKFQWQELIDPMNYDAKIYDRCELNNIAEESSMFRDNFIINQIKPKLHQYKKVLMIYGGSHYYAQAYALEQIII